ncbi:MAG TPA: isopeptide-forming domain-containing fimbrial protein, partial [Casimicrobiaceae bacterium]|nr:isopeptide-forming domain-containing fimbrial protein [Casimicrobiaceae bacterium]
MTSSDTKTARPCGSWIKILLFAFALLLLSAVPAHAQSASCVGTYGGVLDGNVHPTGPSLLLIDGACTIKNYPASNPYTWNISWSGINNTLLIFDNVVFNGNMSCDSNQHGDFVWFVNGSVTRGHILKCANLFAPVDKIDKENPPGPPFVSIGVPFTYTLTFPQLVSATTGAVVNPNGSNVEVDQVAVTDNLNATGVSLSYVNSSAAWKGSGAPVLFAVTNASGLLTFSGFPPIPPGQQIVLSVTVVLNNAVPPNSPGTQFSNTANWTLGTTIGGTFHYPLPGQQGVSSPPLTIAAPGLVMTKGGPATMNPGQLGQFNLNVQNTGNSDAWNATIVDKLPMGPTGGMCNMTPQVLSARVFLADGVTPVAGKGPLTAGTDYTLSYAGAPACTLTLNMLSAAAVISPTQRLIVTYQTQLDANTQNGATLTNVAGTTLWYNGPGGDTGRQSYTCTLTNGTPGVQDCQDAHTVTVVIPALTITKQVAVVGGGLAVPGATLDYLVHVTNTSANPVNPVVITDDLNAAGAGALIYVAGTATMNGSPNGVSVTGNVITANYSATYGPLAPGGTIDLRFRATLGSTLAAGTIVTNTGVVAWNTPPQTASASVSITIGGVVGTPNLVFTKSGPATMSLGQSAQFGFNVQNTGTSDAWNVTLLDRLPRGGTGGMCSTTPQVLSAQLFQADGVTPVAGKGPLVPGTDFSISYVGAPTCELTLTVLTAVGTISPNQRLIITYRTQLDANSQNGAQLTNVAGAVQWFNADGSVTTRQAFTRTLTDGTPGVLDFQDAHTVTVVITTIAITKQVSVVGGGAALPGGQLDYLVHVTNVSTNPAPSVVITDDLSTAGAGRLTFVNPPATMNGSTTGVSIVGSLLTANYSAVNGPLQPGQSIDVRFRVQIASGLAAGTTLTNTAVVTWNNPPQTASASVSIDIGGVPGA